MKLISNWTLQAHIQVHLKAIAVISATAIALAGCSSAAPTASTATPSTSAPAAANSTKDGQSDKKEPVTIEYWQYAFAAKVDLVNDLIKEFQAKNPHITVKHTNFPYDQYNEKVATLVPAGKGPDIINLYYGWIPKYVSSGYLQPLPSNGFSEADLKKDFFPVVEAGKIDGKYWAVPTAVRTLALYYNKELFEKAKLDPNKPPANWEELIDYAKKLTEKDAKGQFITEGITWQPNSQIHHWYRDALIYQAGGQDTTPDYKKYLWNASPAGLEAFKFVMDIPLVHKVGTRDFYETDINAFKTGHAGITIDGSNVLGGIKKDAPNLKFGTAPLPSYKNKATQSSYWANGITKGVEGKKLEAATEFLKFLTSKEVQEKWVDKVGELPAKKEVALQDKYAKDPLLGAFIQQLPDAHAHFFVDETAEKDNFVEATDRVLLKNENIQTVFDDLVKKNQKLYDDYWSKKK
ncbi:extracellular solute-binding protein [Paenibacillus sp. WQ 127069]|uniref:Extracellular solute-binding protein n=1 Tax=Paenibacillus baimaensis TaxID=2982185 RepID=A0ABT2UHS7_9BACL|nr:extracellular solute-binding protein [Paenibacillus sp. WQ 127069]MCU6794189.1 extracellular solute-binding protein [Paenibacillus sp. WQ 127069]